MPRRTEDITPLKGLCAIGWLAFFCLPVAAAGLWPWALAMALLPGCLWANGWRLKGYPPISFTYARVLGYALQLTAGIVFAVLAWAIMLAVLVDESIVRREATTWAEELASEMGRPDLLAEMAIVAIGILFLIALAGATRWAWLAAGKAASNPSTTVIRLVQLLRDELIDDHADSVPLPPRLSEISSRMMKRRYLYHGRRSA